MSSTPHRLGESTWPDVDAAAPTNGGDGLTLLVPLGSTEQHGPHLPLDTDTRIAVAIAERAASGRPEVTVAPAMAFGSSGEHTGFAGTVSIGTDALRLVLVELVRSLGPEFSRTVFVNGHGGNADAVNAAVDQLTDEGHRCTAWWPRVNGGDAHAGRIETSLMLAIAPDLVRLDVAEAGETAPISELMPRLREEGLRGVTPNGVLGDPADASAGEGGMFLEGLAANLAQCALSQSALSQSALEDDQ